MADDETYNALPQSAVSEEIQEKVRKGDNGEQGGITRSTALQCMADDETYNALPQSAVYEVIQEKVRKGDNGEQGGITRTTALQFLKMLSACARLCEAFDGLAMLQTIPMDTLQLDVAAVDEVAPPGVAAGEEWVASDMPTPEEIAQSALAQDRARSKLEWTTYQEAASSRLYYHNATRGVTQWERPECLVG
jgi:hypothetical protein